MLPSHVGKPINGFAFSEISNIDLESLSKPHLSGNLEFLHLHFRIPSRSSALQGGLQPANLHDLPGQPIILFSTQRFIFGQQKPEMHSADVLHSPHFSTDFFGKHVGTAGTSDVSSVGGSSLGFTTVGFFPFSSSK